jgi:hypothetical protein
MFDAFKPPSRSFSWLESPGWFWLDIHGYPQHIPSFYHHFFGGSLAKNQPSPWIGLIGATTIPRPIFKMEISQIYIFQNKEKSVVIWRHKFDG